MELFTDRDPEEARKLLDPVIDQMMEAVHRFEGTVNHVMGDGIVALFGAPLAHEDHAVRACYAALRMQEMVKRYADDVRHTEGDPDPNPSRLELGRGDCSLDRQRLADRLHGSRSDHEYRGPHGADGGPGVDPHNRRNAGAG